MENEIVTWKSIGIWPNKTVEAKTIDGYEIVLSDVGGKTGWGVDVYSPRSEHIIEGWDSPEMGWMNALPTLERAQAFALLQVRQHRERVVARAAKEGSRRCTFSVVVDT